MDSKSDQIRRLKEILADLGMSGRISMEQSKAIKEKREFAQELGEFLVTLTHKTWCLTNYLCRGCQRVREVCGPWTSEAWATC